MAIRRPLTLLGIGIVVTLVRALMQLVIPAGEQSVLPPSSFVDQGTLPLAFTVYGTIAYTALTVVFAAYEKHMPGTPRSKGVTWGVLLALIWTAYLAEPLPHVAPADVITYPVADGLALLVLGLLVGRYVATDSDVRRRRARASVFGSWVIAALFALGRLVQYQGFGIYASFDFAPVVSLGWAVATGLVSGFVLMYLWPSVASHDPFRDALRLGVGIFGVNLFFFNFFMPIVFAADIPDLFIRTGVDILSVTVGCWVVGVLTQRRR